MKMKAIVSRIVTQGSIKLFQCTEVGDDNKPKTLGKNVTAMDQTGKAKMDSIVEVTINPTNQAYGKITSIIQ